MQIAAVINCIHQAINSRDTWDIEAEVWKSRLEYAAERIIPALEKYSEKVTDIEIMEIFRIDFLEMLCQDCPAKEAEGVRQLLEMLPCYTPDKKTEESLRKRDKAQDYLGFVLLGVIYESRKLMV